MCEYILLLVIFIHSELEMGLLVLNIYLAMIYVAYFLQWKKMLYKQSHFKIEIILQ